MIRVIRICDKCGKDYEQELPPDSEFVRYEIDFICSDCFLAYRLGEEKYIKKVPEPQKT